MLILTNTSKIRAGRVTLTHKSTQAQLENALKKYPQLGKYIVNSKKSSNDKKEIDAGDGKK